MFALKWKTTQIVLSIILIALPGLTGCAPAATPTEAPVAPEHPAPADSVGDESAPSEANSLPGALTQEIERIVIKNANLTIVVSDPSASIDIISRMAEEMGGFVVTANLYKENLESGAEVPRATITIRVPAERLNEALERIKQESDQEPISEGINSQDVTGDYVDLQSRLKNLEAAEAQLSEIMASATKTEDVLAVYNELVRVREQIEVIKGQIKYYEESAALSSISTELLVDEAVQPLTIGGWQLGGVAKTAVQTLIDTLRFLTKAVIWIVIYLLPVLLVLFIIFVLPVLLIVRYFSRRKARRQAAAQVNAPESGESKS